MGKIDDIIKNRIIEAADIVEVVGEFVDLKDKGVRHIGLCPFHDDRHATNFVVYPAKQCYTCFACGAKGDAVKFIQDYLKLDFPDAIRWLGNKYGIPVDDVPVDYVPPPPRPKPKPKPVLALPMNMVRKSEVFVRDNFVDWLKEGVKWDGAQKKRIKKVLAEYHFGHSTKHDMSIFWQIDQTGRVRTGKMIRYNKNGHRTKGTGYNADWVHATLIRRYDPSTGMMTVEPPYPYPQIFNPDLQEMKQCLFGLHLLDAYKGAAVNIVESEKTALIMAIAYGNHERQVWMACGGKENLTREKLAPIIKEGRQIVLYPDRDAIKEWEKKAREIDYINLFIDAKPVTDWWKHEDGEKADIADVVVRMLNED